VKLECDIILISKDKTEILIGEIKNHLSMNDWEDAREQLTVRMKVFLPESPNVNDDATPRPSELRNVTKVHSLLGCEVVDQEVAKQINQKKFFLAIPSENRYIITFQGKTISPKP